MKTSMKKILGVVCGSAVALAAVGLLQIKQPTVTYATGNTPTEVITDYLTKVQLGQYQEIYDDAQKASGQLNDSAAYQAKVQQVLGNVTDVQYKTLKEEDGVVEYALYVNDENIASVEQVMAYDGTYVAYAHFPEEKDYKLEVPTGSQVTVNGIEVSDAYRKEVGVVANNFSVLYDTTQAPKVDVIYLPDMIDIPSVTIDGQQVAVIKDVTENRLFAGADLTSDEDLKSTLIRYAEICSGFPAQDTSLGAVAGISVTNSKWYSKVSEVQNQWFTSHGTRSYSSENVLRIVKQADDAVVANVIFDYYASNGDVDRTWNCGYQMTLFNVGGQWKIANICIDSTLNPAAKTY